jgi:ABC-type Mn2+/Zn2+ transport system ATPase subunit
MNPHAHPSTSGPLIRLEGVTLGYGTTTVLRSVEWSVQRGDLWAVVGRNGSGKSTLIAAMLGRLSARQGVIHRQPNLTVGSVPQQCDLVGELPMTVSEFVSMGLLAAPVGGRAQVVEAALADCQVQALAARQVWSLSAGERRRAMIARALAQRPELMVLDEPAAGLDEIAERAMIDVLRRIHGDGVTVVWITHDLSHASDLATRIGRVAGHAFQETTPESLRGSSSIDRTSVSR